MHLNGVEIRVSFAEAAPMRCTRLVLAAASMTGFATSAVAEQRRPACADLPLGRGPCRLEPAPTTGHQLIDEELRLVRV